MEFTVSVFLNGHYYSYLASTTDKLLYKLQLKTVPANSDFMPPDQFHLERKNKVWESADCPDEKIKKLFIARFKQLAV